MEGVNDKMRTNKKLCCIIMVMILALSVITTTFAESQSEVNTDELSDQYTMIKEACKQAILLKQLIEIEKVRLSKALKIENNQTEIKEHMEIMASVSNEIRQLKVQLNSYLRQQKVNDNIQQIKLQSDKIAMLLREVKAMNRILFAKSSETPVAVEVGKVFNIIFSAQNVDVTGEIHYRVEYNPNHVKVVDLCSITPGAELQVPFTVGDVTVDYYYENSEKGVIEFTVDKQYIGEGSWAGITSGIKFEGKVSGVETIIKTRVD